MGRNKLALRFRETIKYQGKCIPENVLEQRKEFYLIMKQLNKKGQ